MLLESPKQERNDSEDGQQARYGIAVSPQSISSFKEARAIAVNCVARLSSYDVFTGDNKNRRPDRRLNLTMVSAVQSDVVLGGLACFSTHGYVQLRQSICSSIAALS